MISVVGITISTAALVILLSAFNGIEDMVIKLYSDFDPALTISSKKAKTFNKNFIDSTSISETEGVKNVMRAVEEVVILKNEEKWVHARMLGVDTTFLKTSKMENHIVDGDIRLYDRNNKPLAIFGASLLDKLDGYIPYGEDMYEEIIFYVPLREGKLRPGKNPLSVEKVRVASRINYNREINSEYVIVPYSLGKKLLAYDDDITAYYIAIDEGASLNRVKQRLEELVGPDFRVQTYLEKNELIFKTSQTEKIIVYFILVFIFILTSFNLIASITMLYVEKRPDIKTLYNLGATRKTIFNIFFFKGLMISGRGVLIGLVLGYLVSFSQQLFGIIKMPGSPGDYFPVKTTFADGVFIFFSVVLLGLIVSYFPTKYMVYKNSKLVK